MDNGRVFKLEHMAGSKGPSYRLDFWPNGALMRMLPGDSDDSLPYRYGAEWTFWSNGEKLSYGTLDDHGRCLDGTFLREQPVGEGPMSLRLVWSLLEYASGELVKTTDISAKIDKEWALFSQ